MLSLQVGHQPSCRQHVQCSARQCTACHAGSPGCAQAAKAAPISLAASVAALQRHLH